MKDNKIIAEFMGVVFHDDENQYYNEDGLYVGNTLQYHTSWDWLMPVVMKISDELNKPLDEIISLLTEVSGDNIWDIKSLYSAVVEFINEYNQNR